MGKRYYLIDKPHGMLSQFTREAPDHRTLADLYPFPPGVYPVGRLDRDSEGLLILTDDTRLNHRLLDPANGHRRTYWVRVEGIPDAAALARLRAGPSIRVRGKVHESLPLGVSRIALPIATGIPPRVPPVRYRKSVPDCWLSLTLREGKNRQVRRLCAAVGHPVLRLIRHSIAGVTLKDLQGEPVREVEGDWLYAKLEQA